jgi:hypothetical protein
MPLELLIGAAVGAGLASPGVRNVVRTGVVHGLARVLMAYDNLSAVAADLRSPKKEPAATEPPKKTESPRGNSTTREPASSDKAHADSVPSESV